MAEAQGSVLPSGVPGLDRILGGGVPRGNLVFLIGAPGAGKTILAMQIACQVAASGQQTMFTTAFSEPHNKLLEHMRSLAFFRPDLIGNGIELLNLQSLLRSSTDESVDSIVSAVRRSGTTLVVIDGFGGFIGLVNSSAARAELLYELGSTLSLLGVTVILTTQADPRATAGVPEFTLSDGLLALYYERNRGGHRRYLEVLKLRGAAHLPGLHTIQISSDGLSCFPQIEALHADPAPAFDKARAEFGLSELDAMLAGGLTQGTATMLAGSIGTGKTLASLHFIVAGAERGERGLIVGFQESEPQLLAKAASFGMDLHGLRDRGLVELLTSAPVWLDPDVLVQRVRERIEARDMRRLVVDTSRELELALDASRAPDFLAAMMAHLRARRVTTLLTREIAGNVGSELDLSQSAMAVMSENVLLLQQRDHHPEQRRLVTILKMRFSDYDASAHTFTIAERGMQMTGRLEPPQQLGDAGIPRRAGDG